MKVDNTRPEDRVYAAQPQGNAIFSFGAQSPIKLYGQSPCSGF